MSDATLNLDGVQFERVRKLVDVKYRALADELEVAYYGNWKRSVSYSFQGRDAVAEGLRPKTLFDSLHINLWLQHERELIAVNERLALNEQYDRDRIDPVDVDGNRRSETLDARLAAATDTVTVG